MQYDPPKRVYRSTRCHSLEGHNLNNHIRDNLKSYYIFTKEGSSETLISVEQTSRCHIPLDSF
jgi:hypothetical protein